MRSIRFVRESAFAFVASSRKHLRESVATRRDVDQVRQEIQLAVRDLKMGMGGMLVVLLTALVAVRLFVH